MAVLLERDHDVHLWMKPGPNQFKIFDADGGAYQPDFVVETDREKLIIETKRKSELDDLDVRRKAKAAVLWCMIASEHAATQNEKPWRYSWSRRTPCSRTPRSMAWPGPSHSSRIWSLLGATS